MKLHFFMTRSAGYGATSTRDYELAPTARNCLLASELTSSEDWPHYIERSSGRPTAVVQSRRFGGLHSKPVEANDLIAQTMRAARFEIARVHTRVNSSRLSRALDCIGRAQKSGTVTEKISFYCSSLEALFSNSSAEVTHQVSERHSKILRYCRRADQQAIAPLRGWPRRCVG
jgi:hypothetical protein